MKRTFAALSLLLVAGSLGACIEDDRAEFPEPIIPIDEGLTLVFNRLNGTRADETSFTQLISNVDVYLFDDQWLFVEHRSVSTSQLDEFCGAKFNVPPGTYNVVCWGNLSATTALPTMNPDSTGDDSFISINNGMTGGPVWYAPNKNIGELPGGGGGMDMRYTRADDLSIHATTVVAGRQTTMPLDFGDVHRKVNVYVQGFERSPWYDGKPIVIENCDASGRFDFMLNADPTPVSLVQTGSVLVPDGSVGEMYTSQFYSAQIPMSTSMGICLYNSTTNSVSSGMPIATIHFDDYLTAHQLTDTADIEVLISFDSEIGAFTASVPSWIEHEIDDEL